MHDGHQPPSKTACRLEVVGKVSSIQYDTATSSCLVSTILNGSHIFHLDDNFYGANLSVGLSASGVESYPYHATGEAPLLSSCFLHEGEHFAVGSASGTVTVVSRRSRALTSCYATPDCLPIRSIAEIAGLPNCVLTCTDKGAEVIDVERSQLRVALENPAPGRAVAAVPLGPNTFAVANYDGKVLLYDTRYRCIPSSVLSIPDQISCMTVDKVSGEVCVGAVGGRVFTLRCTEGPHKEQAFGMSTHRSPVRCVSMARGRIAAGDLAGRLALIDTAEVPDPTVYWSAETLLSAPRRSCADGHDREEVEGNCRGSSMCCAEAEVTAVALAEGTVWVSFCSPKTTTSQMVAIPA